MKERYTGQDIYYEFSERQVSLAEMENFYRIEPKEIPKDRPYVWYMFVETADGIGSLLEKNYPDVSIGLSGPGIALKQFHKTRSEAAGSDTDWRLLQYGWYKADAVVSGSGVLRAEPGLLWKPEDEDLLRESEPWRVIITGKGFDAQEMSYPVLWPQQKGIRTMVATSERGKEHMMAQMRRINEEMPPAEFVTFGEDRVNFPLLLSTLRQEYGIISLDLQGGPDIAGQFFKAGLVDEYRVTISPAIAGFVNSEGERRPSAVKAGFPPEGLQTMSLIKIGRSADHLFLRYKV